MAETQVVVFSLNKENCGVETSQVQKIVKYQDVFKVAKMPKFIEGIFNYRGSVIPAIDLNKRFEFGETQITNNTKIVVTQIKNSLVGFIVNDVSEILTLADGDIEETPEIIYSYGNNFLKCVGKKNDKLISILDLGLILNESEVKKIDNKKFADKGRVS